MAYTENANKFEDLSGGGIGPVFANPYQGLLSSSNNQAAEIQARYATHRTARNAQQRTRLLANDFPGVTPDPILQRLVFPDIEPGFRDERYCLVYWARPPRKVRQLVDRVQTRLKAVAPSLWLMPLDNLHLTVLEITHSKTPAEIAALVETLRPSVAKITDFTLTHRARLIKPMISFDASALALSFIPAAGEGLSRGREAKDDAYTYHHLRRDVYDLCKETGAEIASRYTVPSSHLTIGRFVTTGDFARDDDPQQSDPAKMRRLVETIEEINAELEHEFWPNHDREPIAEGGEWVVGEEKGLDHRHGTLWYGGGETIRLGKGFEI